MKRQIVSIDLGTGYYKLYRGGDPKKKAVTKVHNAFGAVTERLLSDGKDIPICFEGIEGRGVPFSADEFALEYGGQATTKQDRQCLDSINTERGIMAVLAKADIQDGDVLSPVFCIPISEYAATDKNDPDIRIHVQQLKRRWRGEHSFMVLNQPQVKFTFTEPRVTMQGIAACFHYAFSLDGKYVHDIANEDVFLIDTGKRDANHALIHNGDNSIEGFTGTFDGLSWAGVIGEVKRWLFKEHGAVFADLEVERACEKKRVYDIDEKTGERKENYMIFWQDWIVLDEVLQDTIATYARRQTDKISAFPFDKWPHLLLCGGPAGHFLPYYQQYLDRRFALISPYYDVATVLGGYQIGKLWQEQETNNV